MRKSIITVFSNKPIALIYTSQANTTTTIIFTIRQSTINLAATAIAFTFFNYWDFGWFLYAEHFAIEEAIRGNKLGEKVMNMMKPTQNTPLVFEVELPDDEMAARRIEFYRRLGYEIVPVDYLQPPYNKQGYYQPLYLMTDQVEFVVANYEKIKSTIYRRVYHVME